MQLTDTKTFVPGDDGWDPKELCGGSQMEFEWTVPAAFLPRNASAIYRYLLVKESEGLLATVPVPAPSAMALLPSTSIGGYFSILPAFTLNTTPRPAAPTPGPSVGEKAGIGAGVALGALSCLAGGVYFFLRLRRPTRRTCTK